MFKLPNDVKIAHNWLHVLSAMFTYRRIGSNPISPGIDPSSLSGRTKKGTDFENSSAFSATELVRWAVYMYNDIHMMNV